MVWIATDDFDSYTPGAALHGANGGTDWAAAWVTSGTSWTTETAPAGGQGGVCLRNVFASGEFQAYRDLAAISSGILSFQIRLSSATPPADYIEAGLYDTGGGVFRMQVRFHESGEIQISNDTVYEAIQSFNADTWYTIDLNFDDTAQPDQYRARVNTGTWTGWKSVNFPPYTSVDRFRLINEATGVTLHVDDIKAGVDRRFILGTH